MEAQADFFGTRADPPVDYNSHAYRDIVPDQFFLLLTNIVGKLGQSVLIDRFTGEQVWNQPLAGYRIDPPSRADYLGSSPNAPHVYRIQLTATIWWARDEVRPETQTGAFNFVDDESFESRALRFELEDIGLLSLPAILHWNLDHFVVLKLTGHAQGNREIGRPDHDRINTGYGQ